MSTDGEGDRGFRHTEEEGGYPYGRGGWPPASPLSETRGVREESPGRRQRRTGVAEADDGLVSQVVLKPAPGKASVPGSLGIRRGKKRKARDSAWRRLLQERKSRIKVGLKDEKINVSPATPPKLPPAPPLSQERSLDKLPSGLTLTRP